MSLIAHRNTRLAAVGTLLLSLPFAAFGGKESTPLAQTLLHAPTPAQVTLRALSEIDGDPTTFTADERAKMMVLSQVLGTTPIEPTQDAALNT